MDIQHAVDNTGKVWIGTQSEGLDLFDPATGKTTTFHHDPNNPNSLGYDWISEIVQDPSGTIWIGLMAGDNRFDPATQAFSHYHHNRKILPVGATIISGQSLKIDRVDLDWYI